MYIKTDTKYTCQGEHVKLHLKCPDTGAVYKPNVQPTKNKLAWVKYLHKEDKDTYTEGIQAAQYIQASESKTRILGKRLIDGENLDQLVREPGFEHFVPVYKNIKVSLEAYRLDSEQGYEAKGMRGIWFYGPPGSGKSHAAREKSIKMFGEQPFVMTGSKWFDGYKGEKVIIVEDLDKYTCHSNQLGHYLKIWGDKYKCSGEIKGGTVPLLHRVLIVTSNYQIKDLFAPDEERMTNMQVNRAQAIIKAIEDRFLLVKKFERGRVPPRAPDQ